MSDLDLPESFSDREIVPAGQGREEDLSSSPEEATVTSGESKASIAGTRWQAFLMLTALFSLSIFASSRTGLPSPVAANAPDSVFSSARAMTTLTGMVRRAHPPGSPEHAWVRSFIVEEMLKLGLDPQVQTTTSVLQGFDGARAATVRNIIARVPGTSPTGAVLITAHYDSREIAVGAGDDGSGVVAALESIRAVRTGLPLLNDLIVVFTDAEEIGLMGARAFVAEHEWMPDVDIVLSFEMRGSGGPSIMFETADQNGWIIRTLKEWDTHPFANSMSYEVYQRMPNGTDFTPFIEAGTQGLNFASIDNAHVYHQVFDTPENLSEATLQHHGIHALGALKYYGNADLSETLAENVVYFSLPALGLVVYGRGWVLPISGLIIVLLALVVAVARRCGASSKRLLVGFLVSLVVLVTSFGFGHALMQVLPGLHPEYGMLQGSVFHQEGWYVLALGFAVLSVTALFAAFVGRWISIVELSLGSLLIPASLAIGLSVAAPLAAMNFQWPVIASAFSVLILAVRGGREQTSVGWVLSLLLAAPVILMLEPVIELIWLALRLEMAGVIGSLIGVMVLLCLPALNALREPNAWWFPLAAGTLSVASLAVGLVGAESSRARPAPSTLVYAYEHGTGQAVWATSPGPEDRLGFAWARSAARASFDGTKDLSSFGYRSGMVPVASAPIYEALPPAAYVTTDTVVDASRLVELQVRSRIGAEVMRFHLEEGVVLESINGVQLRDPEGAWWAEHRGEPEGFVALGLKMPAGKPIDMHVIEHLLRPQEITGEERFERPQHLAPNVNWMSDRAMFRFSVAAFADPQYAIVELANPPEELSELLLAEEKGSRSP